MRMAKAMRLLYYPVFTSFELGRGHSLFAQPFPRPVIVVVTCLGLGSLLRGGQSSLPEKASGGKGLLKLDELGGGAALVRMGSSGAAPERLANLVLRCARLHTKNLPESQWLAAWCCETRVDFISAATRRVGKVDTAFIPPFVLLWPVP